MVRALPWLVAALFCAGVVAGVAAFWLASNSQTASRAGDDAATTGTQTGHEPAPPLPDAPGHHETVAEPAVLFGDLHPAAMLASEPESAKDSRLVIEALLVQVRELILAGGFDRAAALIRQQTDHQPPGTSPRWAECRVWLGLAEELAGHLGAAEAAYAAALRHHPGPRAELFALTGVVRIWSAGGRLDEAIELGTDLYLQSGLMTASDRWAMAEAHWQLAMVLMETSSTARISSSTSGLWFEQPQAAVELMVSALWPAELEPGTTNLEEDGPPSPVPAIEAAHASDGTPPSALPSHTDVDHPGPEHEAAAPQDGPATGGEIDVNLPADSYQAMFQRIASGPGWQVASTPEARHRLTARCKSVLVASQPVELLLDLLALSAGVMWQVEQGELRLAAPSPASVRLLRQRACQRLLEGFATRYSDDSRRAWCQLALGNLALEASQPDAAAWHWHEARRAGATGELEAGLLVNEAQLNQLLGRSLAARQNLLDAIDSTWNLGLQGEAWARLASLSLDNGAFADARHAAVRCGRLSVREETRLQAALGLATAYLHESNPWAANQVIFDHRELLAGSPVEPVAAFLGSFSRYLGSQTTVARSREEPRLLATVTSVSRGVELSPPVAALVADAWDQLGFADRAAEVVTPHVTIGAGPFWNGRLALMLAGYRQKDGVPADAREVLDRISQQPETGMATEAALELARLQLESGQPESAIEAARALLLPGIPDDTRKQALSLMGRAYGKLDQPHSAALCFAGLCPVESPSATSVATPANGMELSHESGAGH